MVISLFTASLIIFVTGLFNAIVPGDKLYFSVALLYILSPKAKPPGKTNKSTLFNKLISSLLCQI